MVLIAKTVASGQRDAQTDGAVVAAEHVGQRVRVDDGVRQAPTRENVIETPTAIFFARAGAIAPIRKRTRVGSMRAKCVDQIALFELSLIHI